MPAYPLLYGVVLSILQKLQLYDPPKRRPLDFLIPSLRWQWVASLTTLAVILEQVENLPDFHLNEDIQDALYEINDVMDTNYKINEMRNEIHLVTGSMEIMSDAVQKVLQANASLAMQLGLSKDISRLCITSPFTPSPTKLKCPDVELPPHLVPCFAYCALYPAGHVIVREILVNQWIAQGFLSPLRLVLGRGRIDHDEAQQQEDMGDRYFNELLSLGLFQHPVFAIGGSSDQLPQAAPERVYSCEIPPSAHAAACRIAHNEVAIIPNSLYHSSVEVPSSVRYIAFESEHRSSDQLKGAVARKEAVVKVRTCMFFGSSAKSLEASLLGTNNLNYSCLSVLDLSGSQFEHMPNLPILLKKKLRYLALSRNVIIKKLEFDFSQYRKLETFALDGCSQLKKLHFTRIPETISYLYLTSKQTSLSLHRFRCVRILELSHCTELIFLYVGLKNLRKLRIFCCDRLISLGESMMECEIVGVEELILHNCARLCLKDEIDVNHWPRLRYLEIIGLPKLVELPAWLKSATALQHFTIANCNSLERLLTDGMQHLKSLTSFHIDNCPELLALPKEIHSLTNLKSLNITRCPSLFQGFAVNTAEDSPFISHISEIILEKDCHGNQVRN